MTKHTPTTANDDFAHKILAWFYQYGRHDLPWQQLHTDTPNPYPVWISEIMLQQTQVTTVIDYFQRFMARFPTLIDLAMADNDSVMAHWAGLGYYARARNLHKTAKALHTIIEDTGDYPKTLSEWQALAGIGRSTAGAIMAMGLGQFGVICDGNVKRVLTRHFGIADDIKKNATEKALWELATQLTPKDKSNHYAQAMMDLGATICTHTKPLCLTCPIMESCVAHRQGTPTIYPFKSKPKPKPTHQSDVYLISYQQKTLWLKRPDDGIWGNLWCLPMTSTSLPATFGEQLIFDDLSLANTTHQGHIRHTLTHFYWELDLYILPINQPTFKQLSQTLHASLVEFCWQDDQQDNHLSLPTAIKKLLDIKRRNKA